MSVAKHVGVRAKARAVHVHVAGAVEGGTFVTTFRNAKNNLSVKSKLK